jgi:hypothetical protein
MMIKALPRACSRGQGTWRAGLACDGSLDVTARLHQQQEGHRAWLKLEAASTGSGRQRHQGNESALAFAKPPPAMSMSPRVSHVGERSRPPHSITQFTCSSSQAEQFGPSPDAYQADAINPAR